jgi:hypothetical protein
MVSHLETQTFSYAMRHHFWEVVTQTREYDDVVTDVFRVRRQAGLLRSGLYGVFSKKRSLETLTDIAPQVGALAEKFRALMSDTENILNWKKYFHLEMIGESFFYKKSYEELDDLIDMKSDLRHSAFASLLDKEANTISDDLRFFRRELADFANEVRHAKKMRIRSAKALVALAAVTTLFTGVALFLDRTSKHQAFSRYGDG